MSSREVTSDQGTRSTAAAGATVARTADHGMLNRRPVGTERETRPADGMH